MESPTEPVTERRQRKLESTSIFVKNVDKNKCRFVSFLAVLSRTMKQLAGHSNNRTKAIAELRISDHCKQQASHAVLAAIINSILSILQSQWDVGSVQSYNLLIAR